MKCFGLSLLGWLATGLALALAQGPLQTEFYPLKVGHRWTYRAIDVDSTKAKKDDKLVGSKRRYPQIVIEVDRTETFDRPVKDNTKQEAPEKVTGFVLRSTGGGQTTLDHVVVLPDGVHRVAVAETANSPPVPITPSLLFFKQPTKSGDSWPIESKSGNKDLKGTFTASNQDVKVPAGEFKNAFMISYRDGPANNPREIDTWFAANVGMVKQRIKTKNKELIRELEQFDPAK